MKKKVKITESQLREMIGKCIQEMAPYWDADDIESYYNEKDRKSSKARKIGKGNRNLHEGCEDMDTWELWDMIVEQYGAEALLDTVKNFFTSDDIRELLMEFCRNEDFDYFNGDGEEY